MLAIPEFRGRVAPVFDTCCTLLVFDPRCAERGIAPFEGWEIVHKSIRARVLKERGVQLVLCGGISAAMARALDRAGIRLIPWKSGDIHEVLNAYLEGRLEDPRFAMPGCCNPMGAGAHHAHGRCRRNPRSSAHIFSEEAVETEVGLNREVPE